MTSEDHRRAIDSGAEREIETAGRGASGLATAHRIALALVLLLAGGLRLRCVTASLADEFAWREGSTAMMAENLYLGRTGILVPLVNWAGPDAGIQGREFQLYTFLVSRLYGWFGLHELLGRALSAACGIASTWLLFWLTRRLWTVRGALLTAAVYACLPGAAFIDQSFLPDALMLTFALAGAALAVGMPGRSRSGKTLALALVLSLAVLTKLPALVVLPAICRYGARYRSTSDQGTWFGSSQAVAALLALLPAATYYFWNIRLALSSPSPHVASWGHWLWSLSLETVIAERYWLPGAWHQASTWLWGLPFCALAVVGVVLSGTRRWRPSTRGESSLAQDAVGFYSWWLGGCAIFYLIGARELRDNWWNFQIFQPPVAFFVALAIESMVSRRLPSAARALLASSVLAGAGAIGEIEVAKLRDRPHTLRAIELGKKLRELGADSDLAITLTHPTGDPIALYYSHLRGWVFPAVHPPVGGWVFPPMRAEESVEKLETARRGGAKWFGMTREEWRPMRYLLEDGSLFREYLLARADLVVSRPEFEIWRFHAGEPPAIDD